MPIVGHGIDVVDITRFAHTLERTPNLITRLFTDSEATMSIESRAARFAAKEALIKALGDSDGVRWRDIDIPRTGQRPEFVLSGAIAHRIERDGIRLHLSMSHDGGIATASVIAEALA